MIKNIALFILVTFQTNLTFGMMRALNTAATGMSAQEANVSTISNNIANVNTVGYKKNRTEFEDLLYETVQDPGGRSSASTQYSIGIQYGTGARVSGIKKNFSIGNPMITNNPFDLMISGDGFFGIVLPNGTIKYTRDGSFSVDKNGTLVTKKGYRVFPNFTFPAGTTNIKISETGIVEAYLKGQLEPINLGSIPLFTFNNPSGLKTIGGNFYEISPSSGPPIQQVAGQNNSGTIMQGTLEASNVSIMNEMTSLIKAQRAYEMNSKVMGVADQMLQTINSLR